MKKLVIIGLGGRDVKSKVEEDKIKELEHDIEHGVQEGFISMSKYDNKLQGGAKRQYEPCMFRRREASLIFVTDESAIAIPKRMAPGQRSGPGPIIQA